MSTKTDETYILVNRGPGRQIFPFAGGSVIVEPGETQVAHSELQRVRTEVESAGIQIRRAG